MLKLLIVVAVVFAIALGFHRLKDTSGEVTLTLADTAYAVDLTIAVIALLGLILVTMGLIWFAQELIRAPARIAFGWRRRNLEQGRAAVSQGLIAVAAGDLRLALAEWDALPEAAKTRLAEWASGAQARGAAEELAVRLRSDALARLKPQG